MALRGACWARSEGTSGGAAGDDAPMAAQMIDPAMQRRPPTFIPSTSNEPEADAAATRERRLSRPYTCAAMRRDFYLAAPGRACLAAVEWIA